MRVVLLLKRHYIWDVSNHTPKKPPQLDSFAVKRRPPPNENITQAILDENQLICILGLQNRAQQQIVNDQYFRLSDTLDNMRRIAASNWHFYILWSIGLAKSGHWRVKDESHHAPYREPNVEGLPSLFKLLWKLTINI
jgi:hypothetical protein